MKFSSLSSSSSLPFKPKPYGIIHVRGAGTIGTGLNSTNWGLETNELRGDRRDDRVLMGFVLVVLDLTDSVLARFALRVVAASSSSTDSLEERFFATLGLEVDFSTALGSFAEVDEPRRRAEERRVGLVVSDLLDLLALLPLRGLAASLAWGFGWAATAVDLEALVVRFAVASEPFLD